MKGNESTYFDITTGKVRKNRWTSHVGWDDTEECSRCDGTGAVNRVSVRCTKCNGYGEVRGYECPKCMGDGWVESAGSTCPDCLGAGRSASSGPIQKF